MSSKKGMPKKNSTKKPAEKTPVGSPQQKTPFTFKAKPGTYEAILEASAFAKKAGLKNYARA